MQPSLKHRQSFSARARQTFRTVVRCRAYYLLLLPFFLFIVVFKYLPMYGVTLAFKDFKIIKGISGSPWAGFKYFDQLFSSYSFFEVLRNTLIISLEKLLIGFPAPIILALYVNEIRHDRAKRIFQTFSYLPHFISWIIAAALITDVFSLRGPVNAIIAGMGGKQIYFLADTAWFRPLIVITFIWKSCGWSAIVYIAAIAGIDPGLYEAATIDGANKRQTILHVTLPCISSTILTLFILEVGKMMTAGFDQVYNLYSPPVYSVGDILDTYTYRQGLVSNNYSYATAAGLFQNVVGFVLVIISNTVVKHLGDSEGQLW